MLSGIFKKEFKIFRNYITQPAKNSYNEPIFKEEVIRINIGRIAFFSLIISICDFLIAVALFIYNAFVRNIINDKLFNNLLFLHLLVIGTFFLFHWVAKKILKKSKINFNLAHALTLAFASLCIIFSIAVSLVEEQLGGIASLYLIVFCSLLIIFHWNFQQAIFLVIISNITYLVIVKLSGQNDIIYAGQVIYTILFSFIFFLLSRHHYRNKILEFNQIQEFADQSELLQLRNEELSLAHATLSSINRSIVQGFFRLDRNGNLLYANPFLANLFGFESSEEMIQKWSLQTLFGEEELKKMRDELVTKRFLKNKEISFTREDQPVFWGIINCYLEYQDDEIFFDGTLLDNTERKNEQTLLENLSLVASKTDNAVFIIDNNEKIEWVNNAFTIQTGYTLDEAKGRKPGALFQGKNIDPDTILKIGDRISKGLSFTGEMLNYHKNGNEFWVNIALNPILNNNNEIVKYVVVQSDITDRKNVEKELIKAKEEAERLVKVKEEFLGMVSHELRTPLNAVIGMSHLLLQESPRQDQVPNLSSLKVSAEYLLSLINDILDFSKIEAGKITIDNATFNFINFVHSVEQTFFYLAEEKNIQFNCKIPSEIPASLVGDPVRLNQILFNLLSNAIKFTDAGVVELEIEILQQDEDKIDLNFIVRDTGIGIPPEKLNSIFDRFEQVNPHSSLSKRGGTGLGLAITKSLIDMMEGKIKVESTENIGSAFTVQLTLAVSNQTEVKPIPVESESFDLSQINLLLVEDNKINQMVAIKFLKKWKIQYKVVENGRLAYALAKKYKFNLILMDLQMPEMDGYESTRLIRQLKGYEKTPILALTAASLDAKDDVFSCGMSDFIIKPFNPVELYSKIKKHGNVVVNHSPQDPFSLEIEEINRIASGDKQFVIELINICIEQFTIVPQQLRDAFEKKDTKAILNLMHKIKPSIKMLKNTAMSNAATALASCFKEESSSDELKNQKLEQFNNITRQLNLKLKEKAYELKEIIY